MDSLSGVQKHAGAFAPNWSTLVARQSELKLLDLHGNGFTEEQKQRVRNAVASPDCRLVFTDGLLKQLRTAQVHFC